MKKKLGAISLLFFYPICFAQLSLKADTKPVELPWEAPATISWVKNGDGSSAGTIDAVLRYTHIFPGKLIGLKQGMSAMQDRYGFGAFIHRDTSDAAPRNDRGVSFSYGGIYAPDMGGSGSEFSFGWEGNVSLGKSLQKITDSAGNSKRDDLNKDREMLLISGYYRLPISGTPITNPRPFVTFFTARAGVYSDHSSGGNSAGIGGRLSGTLADTAVNIAPLGLNPESNKLGSLGMVPTIRLAAQLERDSSATGFRQRDTYKLYTAALSINFAKLDKNGTGLIPSLNLIRTVGADLLTGRPYQTKTEISFGLTF